MVEIVRLYSFLACVEVQKGQGTDFCAAINQQEMQIIFHLHIWVDF